MKNRIVGVVDRLFSSFQYFIILQRWKKRWINLKLISAIRWSIYYKASNLSSSPPPSSSLPNKNTHQKNKSVFSNMLPELNSILLGEDLVFFCFFVC